MALHRLELIGRLTADPDLRYTPNGAPVLHCRVAVNESYKGTDGEWKEEATFYDVPLWGETAESMLDRLHKGNLVFVEGRPRARTYEGRDGQTHLALEVRFARLLSLQGKPITLPSDEQSGTGPQPTVEQPVAGPDPTEDDLVF